MMPPGDPLHMALDQAGRQYNFFSAATRWFVGNPAEND
jgi:hypothetical protein